MMTYLTALLIIAGSGFMLIAGLGVLRMPDLLMRMHAATKAGTLGAGLLLLAVALAYADPGVTVRALATIAFLFLTAPVAAHVIGRAAYNSGRLALWERTCLDELARDRERAAIQPQTRRPDAPAETNAQVPDSPSTSPSAPPKTAR
jgi:multicomponent Na+:H+ antiporter subunit G